jgi:hypothetical protein
MDWLSRHTRAHYQLKAAKRFGLEARHPSRGQGTRQPRLLNLYRSTALPWLWSLNNRSHRLRGAGSAALVAVAGILQPGADYTVTEAPRASATTSGHSSACVFRSPTFLPVSLRLRSRAPRSLATKAALLVLHEGADKRPCVISVIGSRVVGRTQCHGR